MASNVRAIGACALMTEFLFFSSSNADGSILKLAAIGVNNVPQYPAVNARVPQMIGSPPCANTNGTPIPTVITENAANAFPIIIVNNAIPIQYVAAPTNALPVGITLEMMEAILSPTPAAVNKTPKEANN